MKSFNDYVTEYKRQLQRGVIQEAYTRLLKYVSSLKIHFSHKMSENYSFGNISQGYMDFTYFPFFDHFLRERKLRFGIVLNHKEVRFELWLMGQNAEIQRKYWDLLKMTKWNEKRKNIPKYSVLEIVLAENPNFNDLKNLTKEIETKVIESLNEINDYLRKIEN